MKETKNFKVQELEQRLEMKRWGPFKDLNRFPETNPPVVDTSIVW